MCGIAGRFNFNGQPVSEGIVRNMTTALAHRGPDDEGIFVNQTIGLGHRRLSIIDLSPLGHQPMSDPEQKIWIVFNGEIYNFLSLREELEKDGVRFRSKTDTEVIIFLYKKYGVACLERLRGMFAFAIWDSEKKQLFLARDRVGKKPLKYYLDAKGCIFASELKAILKNPEVKREPDFEAIHHYLTYQYTPTPWTGFVGIKKLPPAHYLLVKADGTSELKRYWKLDYSEKWDLSEKEWCEKILNKFEESVKLRMISDVPIGAFLSGGIDSSAIVAIMSKFSSQPVKTFSIAFETKQQSAPNKSFIPFLAGDLYNELPYARKIAQLFHTDHHELIVKPQNIEEILPALAYAYEEPFADSSALPTWYLAELTRKHITVALNGDGGDENFTGYFRYTYHKISSLYQKVPQSIRSKVLKPLLTFLGKSTRSKLLHKASRFANIFQDNPEQFYLRYLTPYSEEEKYNLYTPFFAEKVQNIHSIDLMLQTFAASGATDPIDRALYNNFVSYLPDDLLVKVDIAAMAHALEGRSPFLDHELIELTCKIPSQLKLKGFFNHKYILKKTFAHILPKEIINRPKQGFSVPISEWFKGPTEHYAKSILLGDKFINRGLFKKTELEKLFALNTSAPGVDYGKRFWQLLFLEHWFRQYFD